MGKYSIVDNMGNSLGLGLVKVVHFKKVMEYAIETDYTDALFLYLAFFSNFNSLSVSLWFTTSLNQLKSKYFCYRLL